MDEDPDVSQASVLGIGGVPHELGAPRPVGLGAEGRCCAVRKLIRNAPYPQTR